MIVGDSPCVERDDPARDVVGRHGGHGVAILLLHGVIAAGDLDKCQHSTRRCRCLGIGVEQSLPSCRAELDDLLEALDPKFPKDVTVAFVDGEQGL